MIHDTCLLAAAALSAMAALLHVGCIAFGAPWYRFFGAGERMARMAEAGRWFPTIVTALIAGVLAVWSLYAFSGAGVIAALPLRRTVLCAATAAYLLRGIAIVPLLLLDPGKNTPFWWWSSGICLLIGAVHAMGVGHAWAHL